MAKTMTITALKGYQPVHAFTETWGDVVQGILRGALKVTKSGGKVTYEDRWSEARVEIQSGGGKVSKIILSS